MVGGLIASPLGYLLNTSIGHLEALGLWANLIGLALSLIIIFVVAEVIVRRTKDLGGREIPNAEQGFTLIFSGLPFPGHQYRLDWRREEAGGNWYYSADLDMEGWLCPALFRYFTKTPEALYAQIKARS